MGVIMGFLREKWLKQKNSKAITQYLYYSSKTKKKYPIFIPLNKVLGGAISIWSHTTLKKIYM
jgi:hypothetical protein